MNGECPKCQQTTKLTKHHILVRRFFGHSENSPILLICRTCHDEIHRLIPEELKTINFYWEVVFIFLASNRIRVMEWSGKRSYYVRRYEQDHAMQPLSETFGQVLHELSG